MSPPGRPKGEYRSAQREGSPVSPPGRPKGEYRSAQREGIPVGPPGRPKGEYRSAQREGIPVSQPSRHRLRLSRCARWPLVLLAASVIGQAQTPPPAAAVRTVTDTYFGTSVPDPYRYLEDMKSPDVAAWMKAQADFTRATLDRIPGRAALARRIGELGDAVPARVSGVQVNGTHYYYLKRLATENVARLYVRTGLNGKERLLVDPQAAARARGAHFAIDYYAPSFDNKYVAYGISPGGSEESVLRVIEVATGKETGEAIDRAQFGPPSWTDDNRLHLQPPA